MKLVDELLPEYKFEYVGTTSDDLLIGVEQGKYQVGVKNAFFTQERTEKFIFPKEFLGLSSAGLVLRKEDEGIKTLSDFATKGYSLAPIQLLMSTTKPIQLTKLNYKLVMHSLLMLCNG